MKYFNKTTIGFTLTWLALSVLLICFYFWAISPLISNSPVSTDTFLYYFESADIINGKVPYRDIYENKGPLFLFLFAGLNYFMPWSLFSTTILISICLLGLFLLSYKIARLFLRPYPSFLVSFFPIILLRFINEWWPGTEYFCSPLILLSIYAVCKLFSDNSLLTQRQQFLWGAISGASFGITFWTKYQLIGLWVGLIFTLVLLLILHKISLRKFVSLFLSHLTGFSIPTFGILIYFGIHGAIGDLIQTYFFSRYTFGPQVEHVNSVATLTAPPPRRILLLSLLRKPICRCDKSFTIYLRYRIRNFWNRHFNYSICTQ
jgi:hypothetical protein